MGYTHYMRKLVPDKNLAEITKKIVELGGVEICGGLGTGEPVITENKIILNGSKRLNQDYETFALTNPPEDFNFTKTEYRPYDKVVVAILCSALYLKCKGSKNISSDGNYGDWDSSGGIDLFKKAYEEVFHEKVDDEKFTYMLKHRIGE